MKIKLLLLSAMILAVAGVSVAGPKTVEAYGCDERWRSVERGPAGEFRLLE